MKIKSNTSENEILIQIFYHTKEERQVTRDKVTTPAHTVHVIFYIIRTYN